MPDPQQASQQRSGWAIVLSDEAAKQFFAYPINPGAGQTPTVFWCGYIPQKGRPGMGTHAWKWGSDGLRDAVRFTDKRDAEASGVGAPNIPYSRLDELPGRGVAYKYIG